MCPDRARNLDWLCWGQGQQQITAVMWSVVVVCCWSSPARSFLVPSPAGLMALRVMQLFCSVQYSPFQPSKMLMVLASAVFLGFGPHRDPWSISFFVPRPFMCRKPVGLVNCCRSSRQYSRSWSRVPRDSGPYFSDPGFLSTALPCTAHAFPTPDHECTTSETKSIVARWIIFGWLMPKKNEFCLTDIACFEEIDVSDLDL
jgi:hypothetical protein